MGLPMLPDELLLTLADQWPCREGQLRQLGALLYPTSLSSPSILVVYGPRATGKSSVIASFLASQQLHHAIVRCRECVTGRHFLERTASAVRAALDTLNKDKSVIEHSGTCESVSSLVVLLERRLLDIDHKFVLVLDDVDTQRDAPPTLLPALARLGEVVPNLTVVLIVKHPPPRFLHRTGVPYVHFTPYTRTQAVHIVSRTPQDIFTEPPPDELGYDDEVHDEDKAWLWPRFCAAVWDALAENAARDLETFRDLCNTLWRPFVAPIIKGDFGTRDFSRLLVAQRRLFQEETVILDSFLPKSEAVIPSQGVDEMPYYTKWVLLAAYLASFNPAKSDALYFMKSTERKRRKKGGGAARSGGRPSQNRKTPRHLLAASAFALDRLLALLHAILPDDLRTSIDVYKQISTLSSLRLLVRTGTIGNNDSLDPGGKWRVGAIVTWEYAQSIGRNVDFNISDYMAE